MAAGETEGGQETLADTGVVVPEVLLGVVPVDGDGFEEEVGEGLDVAVGPRHLHQHNDAEQVGVDHVLTVFLQLGYHQDTDVEVEQQESHSTEDDRQQNEVGIVPEDGLGECQAGSNELEALPLDHEDDEADDEGQDETSSHR